MEPKYCFLRGFMRSGTNWIGNLLNLHPHIACTGEFHLHRIADAFEHVSAAGRNPVTILMSAKIQSDVAEAYRAFVTRLLDLGMSHLHKPDAFVFVDRTPGPLSQQVLSQSPQLHVVRDGRDCLVSTTFHFLRLQNTKYPFEKAPKMRNKRSRFQKRPGFFKRNPDQLLDIEDWVRSRAHRWSQRYFSDEAFRLANPDQVFSIQYEQLHAETEKFRNSIYQFLGVDPSLALPLDESTRPGFSEENLTSHYRKGSVGDWKSYFTPSVRRWFADEAGAALIAAGYEEDESWVTAD